MGEKLLQVGDAILRMGEKSTEDTVAERFTTENKTVIEIIEDPVDPDKRMQLVHSISDKYQSLGRSGIMILSGENMLDDPNMAKIIDPTKIYVLEV